MSKTNDNKQKNYFLVSDTTFKYMIKSEKFKCWFSDITKEKCNIDLTDYTFIDTELNEGNNTKTYRLDNLLKDKNHNHVIIEMQTYEADEKNTRYLFRVSGNSLKEGENAKLGNVTLIQFDSYEKEEFKNKPVLHYTFREDELDLVKKGIECYEIVLPIFKRILYNKSEVDNRLALFTCEDFEEMKRIAKSKKSMEVIDELEELSMDENFSLMYDEEVARRIEMNEIEERGKERGKEQGIKIGKEQGIEIGKNEERNRIIKLLSKELSIEEISNKMEISKEEVEKVLNNEK